MDTKTEYLCITICPKKFKFTHNVFEVTELCRTRADILKPMLDRTLIASQITKILEIRVSQNLAKFGGQTIRGGRTGEK